VSIAAGGRSCSRSHPKTASGTPEILSPTDAKTVSTAGISCSQIRSTRALQQRRGIESRPNRCGGGSNLTTLTRRRTTPHATFVIVHALLTTLVTHGARGTNGQCWSCVLSSHRKEVDVLHPTARCLGMPRRALCQRCKIELVRVGWIVSKHDSHTRYIGASVPNLRGT